MEERFELAAERIREIAAEATVTEKYIPYFTSLAGQILTFLEEGAFAESDAFWQADLKDLEVRNRALYADILPENYDHSYARPGYSVECFGREYGRLLSVLNYEIRSMIPFAFEGEKEEMLIRMELFLEVYTAFAMEKRDYDERVKEGRESARENGGEPASHSIWKILYSYISDYQEDEDSWRIRHQLIGENDFALRIIQEADLSDLHYLYRFGEYISDNEIRTARHLNQLEESVIGKMADTYTEGYRIGFETTGKDLSSKPTVGITHYLGFERMIRRAAANFEYMDKTVVFYREIETIFRNLNAGRSGYGGAEANPQYRYDHREDLGLFLDERMAARRLEALRDAYHENADKTVLYAGPAVLDVFGEKPFSPADDPARICFDESQQKMMAKYRALASQYYNEAVIGRNRSFTIIAFPLPEIADTQEEYEQIFDEIIRINTLDYEKYRKVQQTLIDTLDTGDHLHVRGRGDNRTDLVVNLHKLTDPAHQTIFENCVADVNIPVGEVFTSPVLKGTNGILHVTRVYLEGLEFRDLSITFTDGMISDYSCGNFEGEDRAYEKGRAYIEENILFHHKTLPMGECAIGTNTTAYAAGVRHNISGKLPILIAEKTGPHFAVGDTCYSHDEDNIVYNPDGKEIVAKENDYSLRRTTDPDHAYFGCHTDITIPYNELGGIDVVTKEGKVIPVITDGRFVLPGTGELNEPLNEL